LFLPPFGIFLIIKWRFVMSPAKKEFAKPSARKSSAGLTKTIVVETDANKPIRKPVAKKLPGVASLNTHASIHAARRADPTLFMRIVSDAPLAGLAAVNSIREGYSARILKAASSFFGVSDARIQQIAHVPATTASRLEKSEARIDSAATERVYRMGTVTRMAIDVFENEASAIDWMRQPNRALGNLAPLDLMDTEPGAAAVRQVLNAIATGGVA
jgi:putative toxin-antitoxin system antitoxin component (TIGR02293 family)